MCCVLGTRGRFASLIPCLCLHDRRPQSRKRLKFVRLISRKCLKRAQLISRKRKRKRLKCVQPTSLKRKHKRKRPKSVQPTSRKRKRQRPKCVQLISRPVLAFLFTRVFRNLAIGFSTRSRKIASGLGLGPGLGSGPGLELGLGLGLGLGVSQQFT